jgi:hypothetical protein
MRIFVKTAAEFSSEIKEDFVQKLEDFKAILRRSFLAELHVA